MAIFTFGPNAKLYWDQYDLSGDVREGSFEIGNEAQDKSVWGDSTRKHRRGLHTVSISASGFAQHDSASPLVDDVLSADVGVSDSVITMGGNVAGTEGDILYTAQGLVVSYQPFGTSIGDLSGFALSAEGSGGWYRGKLMAAKAARTATGTSTGLQLGTIAATKDMHASLHVFSASGTSPTLDVVVESDDNSGFTSAVTRMTFAQKTAAGVEFLGPTAGPGGSDDYWRVSWTIGGTATPTFNFAVVFGDGTIYG